MMATAEPSSYVQDASDLPEGWALPALAEVCKVNPPKAPKDALSSNDLVTFVPMPAVDANSGAIAHPETRQFSAIRNGYTSFMDGDVIFAKITPCMENGKAAIAQQLENGLGFGSTEFHVLRPTSAIIPDYVYHFVRQEAFRKAAEAEMTGSVGQKRVPANFMKTAEIPLPPLSEQRRIVAKVEELLAGVNAARERLARVPLLLKRFRQSALEAACSGRLTADWRGEALPDDGELPSTWRWARFGDVMSELKNGISTRPNQEPPGNPILRISAARPGAVLLSDLRYLPNSDDLIPTYSIRDGDLLFTRYNGSLDLLGVCGMVRGIGSDVVLYPDKLMRVRFDRTDVSPAYCELYFQSPQARDRLTAKAKSSAGQQGVSGADIRSQQIALPSISEQNEIVRRVSALFAFADAIEGRVMVATARAERLTQSILAKAFRGELVPTEAELARREGRDYEPAAALLERIRAQREIVASPPGRRGSVQAAPARSLRRASQEFQDAAVMALLVHELGKSQRASSRFRIQKNLYFLKRRAGQAADAEFAKHAAGPYSPKLRYKGPEAIAVLQRQWLVLKGAGFEPGPNIQDALRYARRYVSSNDVAWVVKQFRNYGDVALERWATVDYAAHELRERRLSVSPRTIIAYLREDPEWAKKLEKPGFDSSVITRTLDGLRASGLFEARSTK